jgi:oligoendopeptidase F
MKKSENPLVNQNEVTFDEQNQMINNDAKAQVDNESEATTDDADEEEIKNFVPEWDLSTFFNGIDDPEITSTQKTIIDSVNDLIKKRDDIPEMKAYELLSFIRDYEEIIAMTRNLAYFASLNLCTQRTNKEALLFDKKIEEFCDNVYDSLSWIHHALFSLPDEKKIEFIQSRKLKNYYEWLLANIIYPPSVSEAVARAIRQMNSLTTGWNSLYKQMVSKLKFTIGKKSYTFDEISEMAHSNKEKATRNKALKVMSEAFTSHGFIFTQTLNSILKKEDTLIKVHVNAKDEEEYRLDALDMDGLSNGLDREDILGIATAVTDSYRPISQRFYKLLAKMHGKQSIDYNDRLQNPIEIDDVNIPYVEAVQMILNTLYQFSEEMAITGLQILNDGKLVHAKPMEGKDSGAFCIRGIKPFIFLNYRGGYNSVLTFAHEFGHAVHHVLSEMSAGVLNDGTPISMSEVASIFNEKLIFNKLLSDGELTSKERLYLLIEDVNRQIADIHRQIAFSKFEARAFRERKSGELSEDRYTQIYSEEMERYLGFPLQEDAKFGWMSIPHIFNSPFYVRYYAFAGMVVNKLWQVYLSGKLEDFDEKYVDMLSNTGVESIEDLLEPFGLDINSPDFWSSALEPISAEIDEIERLAKLEGLL